MEKAVMCDKEKLSNELRRVAKSETSLSGLALKCAEVVRLQTTHLDAEVRKQAVDLIRNWVDYANTNEVSETDLFLVRYHISRFAEEKFSKEGKSLRLIEVDLSTICRSGKNYREIIEPFVSSEIFVDRDVAIVGGVARLALKMYAGIDIENELPINDVDIVLSAKTDVLGKVSRYGADLSGTKVIGDEICAALPGLLARHDCTMNQVAIHKGKLFFSNEALQDIKTGCIRLTAKEDPLFGSDGSITQDGKLYLNSGGLYRGLSFLVRGKGKRLIVSKENLAMEKDSIGRHWLILLFSKILPMKNEDARRVAVGHWYEVARRVGSTETGSPQLFLEELATKYPEARKYAKRDEFDTESQLRWLIGKLTTKGVNEICGSDRVELLPTTYTTGDLELSESVDYDWESFMQTVESIADGS